MKTFTMYEMYSLCLTHDRYLHSCMLLWVSFNANWPKVYSNCCSLLYSGKFSWDKIFTDFTVGLTSAKIKSAN